MNARTEVATEDVANANMFERLARDPSVDVAKIERLFELQERVYARQAEAAFNAALASAQSKMLPIATNAINDQTSSRYAKLAQINKEIVPIYTAEGFSISFNTADCPVQGWQRTLATLSHAEGHSRQYHLDMPPDGVGIAGKTNKTAIHATASSNSYARRYLTCMIFNLTTEDDNDGNLPKNKRGATDGAADKLNPEERAQVSEIVKKAKKWMAQGSLADAVLEAENADMNVEEFVFFWTFFDSKERSALKAEKARMKKQEAEKTRDDVKTISPAAHKRLEARIVELKLSRESVKKYCIEIFSKEHFTDLTQNEYNSLDTALEGMAQNGL